MCGFCWTSWGILGGLSWACWRSRGFSWGGGLVMRVRASCLAFLGAVLGALGRPGVLLRLRLEARVGCCAATVRKTCRNRMDHGGLLGASGGLFGASGGRASWSFSSGVIRRKRRLERQRRNAPQKQELALIAANDGSCLESDRRVVRQDAHRTRAAGSCRQQCAPWRTA